MKGLAFKLQMLLRKGIRKKHVVVLALFLVFIMFLAFAKLRESSISSNQTPPIVIEPFQGNKSAEETGGVINIRSGRIKIV